VRRLQGAVRRGGRLHEGSEGGFDLADAVVDVVSRDPGRFRPLRADRPPKVKLSKIAQLM